MPNNLATASVNALFLPTDADKNTRSSVTRFIGWLDQRGLHWTQADLKDYLDYLLNDSGLSRVSVKKHMERVRGRYRDLQHSNAVRDMIQARIPADATPADVHAITQEFLIRLQNNTEYNKRLAVPITQQTTYTDDKFTWLSREDVNGILYAVTLPRTDIGYRDAAIFGLCLSFGLREAEACAVTVEDLGKTVQSIPGVEVRRGKGDKQRFVQYDELTDFTEYVYLWLEVAGVTSGLVLQGLKPRQLQNRVKLYTEARPHDLRRTYAKLLHSGGRSIEYVKQQLGHSNLETTFRYLGLIHREAK